MDAFHFTVFAAGAGGFAKAIEASPKAVIGIALIAGIAAIGLRYVKR